MVRIRAASAGVRSRIYCGAYAGNGAATQAIVGVGFQPKYMQICPDAFSGTLFKIEQDGLNTFVSNDGANSTRYESDHIISLDADGFTVGDGTASAFGNITNVLGGNYYFVCFG